MNEDKAAQSLRLASAAGLEESLSFPALCRQAARASRRRRHGRVTAERLVQHLQRYGFVVLKRSSATAPSSSQHPHPHTP